SEEPSGTTIEAEKIVAIDPFEIEQQRQCLAYPNIGKHRLACIEHQEFRRLRHAGLDGVADHLARANRGKVVALMPAQRLGLDANVIEATLKRSERTVGRAVEIEFDLVEVPQAPVNRKIAATIIGVACQRHAGAG